MNACFVRQACALIILFTCTNGRAQGPLISYQSAITGLSAPVDIVNAGDGSNRLFIVQQNGVISAWDGTTLSTFLNLGSSAGGANVITFGGERGLLSMAFHPGFNGKTNRYFFVYYTDLSGNVAISRYQTMPLDSNTGDPASAQLLLTIPHPGQSNHNGGKLNFGPDGDLYFATGDGGGANDVPNNAQTKSVLLGKMIRINVDNFNTSPFYTVPADNPYVDSAGFDPKIYNLGLRNPFRWSFDRQTGNMWIGDVGQDAKEEIDFRPADSTGRNNFGWHCYEGSIHTPGVGACTPDPPYDYRPPIFDYDNPNPGSSAVTGGYVYRGTEYPQFRGYYIAADVYSGTVYLVHRSGNTWVTETRTGLQNFVVGFGEAEDGTLYAVSQATNTAYKVVANGGTALPLRLVDFSGQHFPDYNRLRWTVSDPDLSAFDVQFSTDARNFVSVGNVSFNNASSTYRFEHHSTYAGACFYRLAIEGRDGRTAYSSVLKLMADEDGSPGIYPSVLHERTLYIRTTQPAGVLQIIGSSGALVFERRLGNLSGTITVSLPSLPPGIYIARVSYSGGVKQTKVIVTR